MRHFKNPYPEALDVNLDDLIELVAKSNNNPNPAASAERLRSWLSEYKKLDPYILPSNRGWHPLGLRYGNKPNQYLSFSPDKGEELDNLLNKARKQQCP